VQHRRRLRRRWLVKDLAQLAWSAPRDRVNCAIRVAFLKHYLGVRKLRAQDKRLVRRVLAKQQTIERRHGAPVVTPAWNLPESQPVCEIV